MTAAVWAEPPHAPGIIGVSGASQAVMSIVLMGKGMGVNGAMEVDVTRNHRTTNVKNDACKSSKTLQSDKQGSRQKLRTRLYTLICS